jgi:hypothetical protein
MKATTTAALEAIVDKIQVGTFSIVEIIALLIIVRGEEHNSRVLRELGDFVAHDDVRTKGIAHDHIDAFMRKFRMFNERGGTVTIPPPIFDQAQVVSDLVTVLGKNQIPSFDAVKFGDQAFRIMYPVLEIVSDTKIKTARYKNCRLSSIEQSGTEHTVFFVFGPAKGKITFAEMRLPALIATES